MVSELAMFIFKVAAAFAFLFLVEIVLGAIVGLLNLCIFFPPEILLIIKAAVYCVAVSAVYKIFF